MNVLIIQPWIRLGGAELVSTYLAHTLSARGYNTTIACTFLVLHGMQRQAQELNYRLPHRAISRLLAGNRLAFLLLGPWILLWLVWTSSREVDVLNPHEFPSVWVAIVVGAIRRIPVVWSSYGPTRRFGWRDIPNIGFGDWLGWLIASSWLDRLFVRRLSAIHVPSDLSRNLIRERYGRDADVIPLGVDAHFYGAGEASGVLSENGAQGKFVLLTVGKLHPQENQVICLLALKALLPIIPSAFLFIVGDGPMRVRLEGLAARLQIAGHVKFTGHIPSWEVRDYYKACAVHLFPPLQESWGLAPFEALAAGRVSVVSNDCGAAGILSEKGIGIVCPPTPDEFAQKVADVYSNSFPITEMAAAGREFVQTNLTWQEHSDQVLRLMERVSGPQRRTGKATLADEVPYT